MTSKHAGQSFSLGTMRSKVPEVTVFFWIIKILCTTVGETAADYINTTLNLGLTGTTLIMGVLLAAVMVWQFRLRRYVPGVYWLAVVLVSVVGTLITDNLTDNFGVSLWTTTIIFSVVLAAVFFAWFRSEKTLSIHSVLTTQREMFYWLAVLFTFALGTAAGDLVAEKLNLGYWKSALMFVLLIGAVTLAHFSLKNVYLKMDGVLSFWIAYILTRPLGASIGDYLSQDRDAGGLALGTLATSAIFLSAILFVVIYLSVTRKDQVRQPEAAS
ncbi:COG4705 family protein [Deinococcus sp. UYEF24]